jgi:hypothetical protein
MLLKEREKELRIVRKGHDVILEIVDPLDQAKTKSAEMKNARLIRRAKLITKRLQLKIHNKIYFSRAIDSNFGSDLEVHMSS